jgi:DNA-binding CsgD family transcriptional regulator
MSEKIILSIGAKDFARTLFAECRATLSIRQLVAYRYRPGTAVELLLAESADDDGNMHRVIRGYLDSLHQKDPIRACTTPLPARTLNIRHVEAASITDDTFRNDLYRTQNMASKTAIIVQRPQDALAIAFLRGDDVGELSGSQWGFIEQSAGSIAAAVEKHFEFISPPPEIDWEARLGNIKGRPPLSCRETLVCARILEGYFNEAIAQSIGLSVHSVITYRRRAFCKLGISTQNELFTLAIRAQAH